LKRARAIILRKKENGNSEFKKDDVAIVNQNENSNKNVDFFKIYYKYAKEVKPYLTVYSALITVSAISWFFQAN